MILWSMMNDLMMHEMLWFSFWTIWYACMDAWMHEWNLLFFSFFHFFHKSKKCLRSYAYAHVMNHWWCMTCYDFLFKLRRWCIHGCVDAWMKFALFKKMNYSCMHDLVWCMIFYFTVFLKTNSNWFPFHCYFEFMESFYFDFFFTFPNHFLGLINLLTNTFLIISLKHYLNDMHEIAKGLKRFGWGDED